MWLAHLSATCKGPKCLIKTKCVPCQTSPRSPTFEDLQLSFLFIYFFCQNELFATHLLEHKLSWEICLLEDCKIVQLKTFTILWGEKSVLCFF